MNVKMNRRELMQRGAAVAAAAAAPGVAIAEPGRKRAAPGMGLGIVSYNVAKDWDLQTLLNICRAVPLQAVEFRTTHAHGVEPSLTNDQRRAVREKCLEAGMRQTSLGTVCEFHATDLTEVRRNIEMCAHFIELARDIGARGVKVRPNGLPPGRDPEKTLEQIGKALNECGRLAADFGVEIWMEVHGSGTSHPPSCRRIMEHCDHRSVGITWNSNSTDLVDGSVKESYALLAPYIRCVHINDLWSGYPYRELFGLLNDSGYDRFALIECGFTIEPKDGTPFLKCYRALWEELAR